MALSPASASASVNPNQATPDAMPTSFQPQGYSQSDYQNFLSSYQAPVSLDGTPSNIPPPSYDQWSQGIQQSNQQMADPAYQNYWQQWQQNHNPNSGSPITMDEPMSYDQFKSQQASQTTSSPLTQGTPTMATNPLSQIPVTPTTNSPAVPDLGITAGSQSGGSFTQGSALPNITTTQSQATAAPQFYTDYLNQLAQQGGQAAQNAQYVGAQPLQQQAFNQAQQNVGNYQPTLNSAINLAQGVGSSNLAQAIGDLGQSNIAYNLAPQATAGLVGSGQFGSTRGATALGDVISNAELGITAQQQQALQQDYANKVAASGQLGNLASQQQALGLGDVNALATLGGQQQTIAQNQQLFPMQQLTNESALLRGYTMPTSTSSSYTGPIPGAYAASPLQQIAGLGALGAGISNTPLGATLFGTLATGTSPGSSGLVGSGLSSLLGSYSQGTGLAGFFPGSGSGSGSSATTAPIEYNSSGQAVDQFGNLLATNAQNAYGNTGTLDQQNAVQSGQVVPGVVNTGT